MKRNYIGLAATLHDPALAIVDSHGEVVFAEATERAQQVKRAWCCVPDDIIRILPLIERYCEPGARLVSALNWSRGMPGTLQSFFASRPLVSAICTLKGSGPWANDDAVRGLAFLEQQARWLAVGLDAELRQAGNNLAWRNRLEARHSGRLSSPADLEHRAYDHHLCHAAAACYSSPFSRAVCAVIDGYGEKAATSFFHYREGRLKLVGPPRRLGLPPSLGVYYLLLCWACGFDPYKGEEWKVMGLAPYGRLDKRVYELLRPLIRVKGLALRYAGDRDRRIGELLALRRDEGSSPMEAADLAHTGQVVYGELCQQLLRNLHGLGLSDNLVLAGGCALNSSFNGQILERTPFERLFVPSAPADDGTALGAALLAYAEDAGTPPPPVRTPYLGSRMSVEALERVARLGRLPVQRLSPGQAPEVGGRLLSEGKILGWVQGRAEFGPRALGNRSILADPRQTEVKDRLNSQVKYREAFRPFAPSVLEEHAPGWFEQDQPSPHMDRTLSFKPELRDQVPGVVHTNGTGRLQTVGRQDNPPFHQLISAFHRLTGVPMVLNTSFNVMGKPIIHSVEDAISVFFTSGLDALIIEDVLLEKPAR